MSSTQPGLIRRTLRRRRWPIFASWALLTAALMSAAYVLLVGPYRAMSLLRVDPMVTDLYNVRQGRGESLDAFLQTQTQLITSPNVLTAAGTNPKVAVLPRITASADVVQELRKSVQVAVIPNTYLIEVSMTSESPAEAATLVNAVVDSYLEASSEWSDGMARSQIKNLEQYNFELKSQSDELERRWKNLAAQGETGAAQGNLVSRDHASKIDEKLVETDLGRLELQAQLDAINARRKGDGAGQLDDLAKIEELKTRIEAAKLFEQALRARKASSGLNSWTQSTDAVEIALIQDQRKTLIAMQDSVTRRLEQLRFEAKGEARIRPVNEAGAMVPGRRTEPRDRPWVLLAIPFATFALVLSFYSGVEAWSTPKGKGEVGPLEG